MSKDTKIYISKRENSMYKNIKITIQSCLVNPALRPPFPESESGASEDLETSPTSSAGKGHPSSLSRRFSLNQGLALTSATS